MEFVSLQLERLPQYLQKKLVPALAATNWISDVTIFYNISNCTDLGLAMRRQVDKDTERWRLTVRHAYRVRFVGGCSHEQQEGLATYIETAESRCVHVSEPVRCPRRC